MPAKRRHLVIVRAGEKSLHREWLSGGEERSWDLVVSWYGDGPYEPVADERVLIAKGWKWDVLAAQFAAHPELIDDYDYIWVPDDDIRTNAEGIDRLFAITAQHGLALSQPGLDARSYFSHLHTMRARSFLLRYTNFVEVMAPCLSQAALRRVLPYLAATPSGYGLDYVWARLEDDNWCRAAVIDGAPMRHTRPVGKFLKKRMRAAGESQVEQGAAFLARFGMTLEFEDFPCYGGIGRDGRRRGRAETMLRMAVDYLVSVRRWPQKKSFADHFRRMYGRALVATRLGRVHEQAAAPAAAATPTNATG